MNIKNFSLSKKKDGNVYFINVFFICTKIITFVSYDLCIHVTCTSSLRIRGHSSESLLCSDLTDSRDHEQGIISLWYWTYCPTAFICECWIRYEIHLLDFCLFSYKNNARCEGIRVEILRFQNDFSKSVSVRRNLNSWECKRYSSRRKLILQPEKTQGSIFCQFNSLVREPESILNTVDNARLT